MSTVKDRWEQFAEEILALGHGSPLMSGSNVAGWREAAKTYQRYLESLSPEARSYWMVTPTYAPRRMRTTIVPRTLVPLYLERYPEVRERYVNLAEAYFKPVIGPRANPNAPVEKPPRARVLVCEPSFEATTYYGSRIIERYISGPYRLKGVNVDSLWRAMDVRIPFSHRAVESNVICGVGHGNLDIFTGQMLRPLWKANEYDPDETASKSVKLLSCFCGAQLGPNLIQNGARLFQGYQQEYIFFISPHYVLAPWMDPLAGKLFLETYCDGLSRLLDGGTNQEAYDVERSHLANNSEKMREEDPEVASALNHDANALIMLGDPNATT